MEELKQYQRGDSVEIDVDGVWKVGIVLAPAGVGFFPIVQITGSPVPVTIRDPKLIRRRTETAKATILGNNEQNLTGTIVKVFKDYRIEVSINEFDGAPMVVPHSMINITP